MNNYSYGLSPTPQSQPMQSVYLPVINGDAVASYLVGLASENERLQIRLRDKETAERAYSDIKVLNDQTYTFGRTGVPQVLLNRSVKFAYYMRLHSFFRGPPVYVIGLSGIENPLVIDEDTFMSDKKLVSIIRRIPGVEVNIQRTTSTTASLLRHAIDAKVKTVFLDYYGGWSLYGDNAQYMFFPMVELMLLGSKEDYSVGTLSLHLPLLQLQPLHSTYQHSKFSQIHLRVGCFWLVFT